MHDARELNTIIMSSIYALFGDAQGENYCYGLKVENDPKSPSSFVLQCPEESVAYIRSALVMVTPPNYLSSIVYRFDVLDISRLDWHTEKTHVYHFDVRPVFHFPFWNKRSFGIILGHCSHCWNLKPFWWRCRAPISPSLAIDLLLTSRWSVGIRWRRVSVSTFSSNSSFLHLCSQFLDSLKRRPVHHQHHYGLFTKRRMGLLNPSCRPRGD